jgi:hypothetical protein
MLAHGQPVDVTECFGRQLASSCSGKHGFGHAPLMIRRRNVDLHSIGAMMGLLAATPWE